jgi:hypothetical protein
VEWQSVHIDFYRKFGEHYTFCIRGSNGLIQTRFNVLVMTLKPLALPLFILVTKTPQLILDFFNPYYLLKAGWDIA